MEDSIKPKIDAAVINNTPQSVTKSFDFFSDFYGLWDFALGKNMLKKIEHIKKDQKLVDDFKKEFDLDVPQLILDLKKKPSIIHFNKEFICKNFKYKEQFEYY